MDIDKAFYAITMQHLIKIVFAILFVVMLTDNVAAEYITQTWVVEDDSSGDSTFTIEGSSDIDTSAYYNIDRFDHERITLFYYIDDLVTGSDSNDVMIYIYQAESPRSSVYDTSLADFTLTDSIEALNTTTAKWTAHVLTLTGGDGLKFTVNSVATTGDSVLVKMKLIGRYPSYRGW